MVILNIETSTDACSAALTEQGEVMVVDGHRLCRLTPEKSEHARELAMMIDELMSALAATGKTIDAVAVSAGPGSYTGLRIGASTAKGLAYGLNVPLLSIPTLQLMADGVRRKHAIDPDTLLCPMIDARRMEVYNAFFRADATPAGEVVATIVDADSFAGELQGGRVIFFGTGAPKCQPVLTHPSAVFFDGIVPDAADMGYLAEQAYADARFADVAYWTPFYLKEFEAKKAAVKGLN